MVAYISNDAYIRNFMLYVPVEKITHKQRCLHKQLHVICSRENKNP